MDSLVVPFLVLAAALPDCTLPRGSEPERVAANIALETPDDLAALRLSGPLAGTRQPLECAASLSR